MKAFFAALSLLVCGLWLMPASARDTPAYPVMEWVLKPVRDDETGKVESCIAAAKYSRELALFFIMDNDHQASIGLNDTRLSLSGGKTYDVALTIDNKNTFKYEGVSRNENLIAIYFDDDSRNMMHRLRTGSLLEVKLQGRTYVFRLDRADQMLAQLEACVQGKAQAPAPDAAPRVTDATPSANRSASEATQAGSGFFVNGTGTGVTAAHGLTGCTKATLADYGPARILARDTDNDLAVVALEPKTRTHFAKFRKTPVELGETIYAMGFPLAGQLDNGLNFTNGLVSSLAGMGNDARAFQFTAPIQSGSSGGPIVDRAGLVVGIIRSKLNDISMLRESGSLPQNLNFGIRTDLVRRFLSANGIDHSAEEIAPNLEATAIARAGIGYTFQITCTAK